MGGNSKALPTKRERFFFSGEKYICMHLFIYGHTHYPLRKKESEKEDERTIIVFTLSFPS